MKPKVLYVSAKGAAIRVVHAYSRTVKYAAGWPGGPIGKGRPVIIELRGLCSDEGRDLVTANPDFVTCSRCLKKLTQKARKP